MLIQMYGHWATTNIVPDSRLVITMVNRLPVERDSNDPTEEDINKQLVEIRDKIVNRDNYDLEHDHDAMALVIRVHQCINTLH
jgi:hypothetical protein